MRDTQKDGRDPHFPSPAQRKPEVKQALCSLTILIIKKIYIYLEQYRCVTGITSYHSLSDSIAFDSSTFCHKSVNTSCYFNRASVITSGSKVCRSASPSIVSDGLTDLPSGLRECPYQCVILMFLSSSILQI